MRGADLYLAMQELDDVLVEKYADVRPKQPIILRRLIAAGLTVVLLAGSVVAVDAITYAQAKNFFTDNGLSTDGLSREDVRAVYRDITTESFTYDKTDEVIRQSISQAVPGFEIVLDTDDPEKLRLLWESWENGNLARVVIDGEIREFFGEHYQEGVWYDEESIIIYDSETGYRASEKTIVRKHEDDSLCWETTVPFAARLIKPIGEGTVVIGSAVHIMAPAKMAEQVQPQKIAYIDKNGQILWEEVFAEGWYVNDGGRDWLVATVGDNDWAFANGDETFSVFARGVCGDNDESLRCIGVWRYDLKGQRLSCNVINIEKKYLSKVFPFGDYYILTLSDDARELNTVIVNNEGVLLEDIEYQITDQVQRIQDIVENDNYRYISAYTMLAAEGEDEFGRPNIALDEEVKALWQQEEKASEKELIERIRSHYTAVLLRCDIETGEIQTFYSVPGAIADKLEVSESGELIWRLQSLTQAEMITTPNGKMGGIRGTSVVYRYIFDAEGNLKEKENTGELATYRW